MTKVKPPKPRNWRVIEMEVDGVKRSFLTIGAVARALDRAVSTLRVWEREGLLPKTPYRSDSGQRLYTLEQLQEIRLRAKKDPKFADLVRKRKRTDEIVRMVRWVDGTEEKVALYRVRVLAQEIGRTPQTIRLMERRNGLPPTPLRSGNNQRLYTMGMIDAVKKACVNKKYASCWSEIYLYVLTKWQEMGVLGGEVVDTNESTSNRRKTVCGEDEEGGAGDAPSEKSSGGVHSYRPIWESKGTLGAG
jgi:DNA-binding transcriptional MerR regulator